MAVPARRTSKTKKRMRRTHLKKECPSLTNCQKCGETIKPHRVCIKCGFYKGKEVLVKEEKQEETKTEAKPKKEEPKEKSKKDKKAKTE